VLLSGGGSFLFSNHPVNPQNQDGADKCAQKTSGLARLIPPNRFAEKGGEKSAADSQQDGDDEPTRVFARHEQFGARAGEQADQDCVKHGNFSFPNADEPEQKEFCKLI
jgi:hypothetical protein